MVKYVCCVVWATCICFTVARAQDQRLVDSLHLALRDHSGGERFPLLYELAFEYIDRDNEKALAIIVQAEEAAMRSGDSLWIVKSKRVKGQILYKLERIEEAILIFKSGMAVAERNNLKRECQMIANTFGCAYLLLDQFDKGLHYLFMAWELAKKRRDGEYISVSLNNIGLAYYRLGDSKRALEYLLETLELGAKGIPDVATVFVNISLCYSKLKKFGRAKIFLRKSIDACNMECFDRTKMHINFASGLINYGEKNLALAEGDFLRSLKYAKEVDDSRIASDNIYMLTGICLQRDEISKAEHYLRQGERLVDAGAPYPDVVLDVYKRFSEIHFRRKNFRKAAEYQIRYMNFKDSIYSQQMTIRLMAKEAEFLERENEARIQAQADIIQLNQEIIKRQKRANVLVGLLALTTITFLFVLFRSYRRKKRFNVLLNQRVLQRTSELKITQDTLLAELSQQKHILGRVSGLIRQKLCTIKGLLFAARHEASEQVALGYFDEIDELWREVETSLSFTSTETEPVERGG